MNENTLGKCFRSCSSFVNPRISPLTTKYGCPQLSLLIITSVLETNKMGPKSYSIIPCSCIQAIACFEHSNFFKVNVVNPTHTQQRAHAVFAKKSKPVSNTPCGGPTGPLRNPTTSFLTATTLIYAIGAGITAAAGTRLALQLFLVRGFKLYSFRLRDLLRPRIVISCHYLPESGLGNFRACCLP